MNTKRIKQIILPNLPYALLFWMFDKCGEAFRISPGVDVLRKLMRRGREPEYRAVAPYAVV
ncbi:MAG: hypothetical protein LBU36_08685 [Clostridiales bacterium]|jgi:hypothetical protein|nr:hypothetical protein [Clostridiales bacterium]